MMNNLYDSQNTSTKRYIQSVFIHLSLYIKLHIVCLSNFYIKCKIEFFLQNKVRFDWIFKFNLHDDLNLLNIPTKYLVPPHLSQTII